MKALLLPLPIDGSTAIPGDPVKELLPQLGCDRRFADRRRTLRPPQSTHGDRHLWVVRRVCLALLPMIERNPSQSPVDRCHTHCLGEGDDVAQDRLRSCRQGPALLYTAPRCKQLPVARVCDTCVPRVALRCVGSRLRQTCCQISHAVLPLDTTPSEEATCYARMIVTGRPLGVRPSLACVRSAIGGCPERRSKITSHPRATPRRAR